MSKSQVKMLSVGVSLVAWVGVSFGVLLLRSQETQASGAYVDPTKLKKKKKDSSAGKEESSEMSEEEEEAARAAKKEALKKALLKGKQ